MCAATEARTGSDGTVEAFALAGALRVRYALASEGRRSAHCLCRLRFHMAMSAGGESRMGRTGEGAYALARERSEGKLPDADLAFLRACCLARADILADRMWNVSL